MRRPAGFVLDVRELSGALGDLGTLLPLMLGAIAVAGLAPVPVVAGFGLSYVATALVYRLPVPVQPMKAVAAVLLTAGASPSELAASGVVMGAALVILGATGWIGHIARLVPQSVLAGLQLGLGIGLALVGLELMAGEPALGGLVAAILLAAFLRPAFPAAMVAVAVSAAAGWLLGLPGLAVATGGAALPGWPSAAEVEGALTQLVLPQLPLTLTNAVLLTALVAGDCFGARAARVTPRRLSVSSGLANLLLAPLGALPMCHGAGGVVAHHRFGARSGTAPLALGLGLLALAAVPGGVALLAAIPAAGLGALLLVASLELAASRRLFDCRPSCWPVIAATAAATLAADPFWGLVAGTMAEVARRAVLRLRRSADDA